jgi:hypothetical protein
MSVPTIRLNDGNEVIMIMNELGFLHRQLYLS